MVLGWILQLKILKQEAVNSSLLHQFYFNDFLYPTLLIQGLNQVCTLLDAVIKDGVQWSG